MPHRIHNYTNAADYAAATSSAAAGFSWLAPVNEGLQVLATLVAIVAGLYAIKWHQIRIEDLKKKTDEIHAQVVYDESKREES